MSLKVLTLRQPWAWGLIHGPKRIENRSWSTAYRGPLAIHAGSSRASLKTGRPLFPGLPADDELAFGCIIGIVDLLGCVPLAELAGQPFAEGPWCWITANPRPVEPFACPGRLGLWPAPSGWLAGQSLEEKRPGRV